MYTYWNYYEKYFASKIRAIDLFLKTEIHAGITQKEIIRLLCISEEEINTILESNHITTLDVPAFFVVMQNGSSPICKLFSRELQRKMPHFYSYYDISYIYQIPYESVIDGAQKAQISHITSENMPLLFQNIELAFNQFTP